MPPTLFIDVPASATIHKEDLSGPVLVSQTFKTEEAAIEMANDSLFGLAEETLHNPSTNPSKILIAGQDTCTPRT